MPLDAGNQVFEVIKPQTSGCTLNNDTKNWLEAELRSDHAGESGAIAICEGILRTTRDPELVSFALNHRRTEIRHLAWIEEIVPVAGRSRLTFVWTIAGFIIGCLPALFGRNAVYATIDTVETFVESHYTSQINRLETDESKSELRSILVRCRDDEIKHRDQARNFTTEPSGYFLSVWCWMVGIGSAAAVFLARKV